MSLEVPTQTCDLCLRVLLAYAHRLGYTEQEAREALNQIKPYRSWAIISPRNKQGLQTHAFSCRICGSSWKINTLPSPSVSVKVMGT
jgi:hypothetical protein